MNEKQIKAARDMLFTCPETGEETYLIKAVEEDDNGGLTLTTRNISGTHKWKVTVKTRQVDCDCPTTNRFGGNGGHGYLQR